MRRRLELWMRLRGVLSGFGCGSRARRGERQTTAARVRFWREAREGEREAEATAKTREPAGGDGQHFPGLR